MRNGNDFDLSNADALDESVANAIGMNDSFQYSSCCGADGQSNFTNESLLDGLTENTSLLNAEGGGESKVSPEMIQAGIGATTAIVAGIQASKASPSGQAKQDLKNACGRKPLFKKKKAKWQECVNEYMKSKQVAQTPVAPVAPPVDYSQRNMRSGDDSDGKILGMPKGLAIGLGVVLALGLTFVAVKVVRAKMSKK